MKPGLLTGIPFLGDRFVFVRRYVKIDDCDYQFLPPNACSLHKQSGHDDQCENCISAVQPGVFAVKPLVHTWKYYLLDGSGKYVSIRRKQFPIMPFEAVSLYSMQGTTADPGMVITPFTKCMIMGATISRHCILQVSGGLPEHCKTQSF